MTSSKVLFIMRGIGPEAGRVAMARFIDELDKPIEDDESMSFYVSLKVRKRHRPKEPDSMPLPFKDRRRKRKAKEAAAQAAPLFPSE